MDQKSSLDFLFQYTCPKVITSLEKTTDPPVHSVFNWILQQNQFNFNPTFHFMYLDRTWTGE